MSRVQDLYEARVRPMGPAERLQLARLILDDLAAADRPVETSDEWSDEDLTDVTAFAASNAARESRDDGRPS